MYSNMLLYDDEKNIIYYRLVVKVLPEAKCLLDNVESNRKMWIRMNDKLQQLQIGANSMDIFELDLNLELDEKTLEASTSRM